MKFTIEDAVRPTISCESFSLGDKASLALFATGVTPRQGVPFFGTQLAGKIFGYLPMDAGLPVRQWTFELDASDDVEKSKAVFDCLLGGDLFVNK